MQKRKKKAAEFVLAEATYYCVSAKRSAVTDSSFGKWGQISISIVLRGKRAAHPQQWAQKPAKSTFHLSRSKGKHKQQGDACVSLSIQSLKDEVPDFSFNI